VQLATRFGVSRTPIRMAPSSSILGRTAYTRCSR
jgi:hypothetical protein